MSSKTGHNYSELHRGLREQDCLGQQGQKGKCVINRDVRFVKLRVPDVQTTNTSSSTSSTGSQSTGSDPICAAGTKYDSSATPPKCTTCDAGKFAPGNGSACFTCDSGRGHLGPFCVSFPSDRCVD